MSEGIALSLMVYALAILLSLGVALLVRLLVAVLGRVQPRGEPSRSQAPSASAQPPPAHVAAIAAAVADLLGPHRIVHIRARGHADGWAQEGRSAHHQSHNLPRRPRP